MIKRQYFIKLTAASANGGTDHRYRLLTRTSWFNRNTSVLKGELKSFSDDYNIDESMISVDAFNRI